MPKQQHKPTFSRAKIRSAVITDTLEKQRMLEKMLMTKKKRCFAGAKRARYVSFTSSESAQDHLHSLVSLIARADDCVTYSEQSSNEEDSSQINVKSIEANCYVVAKVTTDKNCFKQFVEKVLAGPNSDKDYTISFWCDPGGLKTGLCFPKKKIQHQFLNKKS